MKALTTAGLTKLIQLIKSSFISVDDTVTTTTVTLANVATTGDYNDLINKPSAITVDSALDSTSTNPVENRVIAQALEEISLAKNPNLNLIGGNLSIDSGNVSGFSTTDYMQFPFVFNFNGYHWTLEMGFTTGSAVTTQQNILDSYYGIAFAIRNGKFVLAISSNGSSWDIANAEGTYSVQANTAYSVKIAWDGTNYTLSYALDETNYNTDIAVASTLVHHSTQEYVGGEPDLYGSGQHPFTGTINLNNWNLIVKGLEVWLGMDDVGLGSRANIDLSNLTEAGQYIADTVKDQNDGDRLKYWTGTKVQYDAIATKDANTFYNITDDTNVTLSLLEILYPVGAIYIGTMSTCPLAVLGIGTWQLVSQFIPRELVEKKEPTSTDSTWYNVYSDGWCEQGGTTQGGVNIGFLKPFTNTNYTLAFSNYYYSASAGTPTTCYSDKSSTGFFLQTRWNGSGTNFECSWRACGYTSSVTSTIYNKWERIS